LAILHVADDELRFFSMATGLREKRTGLPPSGSFCLICRLYNQSSCLPFCYEVNLGARRIGDPKLFWYSTAEDPRRVDIWFLGLDEYLRIGE